MAPIIRALRDAPGLEARVCVTAQHRGMLDQVLDFFDIVPDHDLDLMSEGQGLAAVTSGILLGIDTLLGEHPADLVLVQGDTNTTMSTALAAYYSAVPVAHVEAGLRTSDLYAPWPEEGNRRVTSILAGLHFAPTESARDNLLREGVEEARIVVTGNTVVDALHWTRSRITEDESLRSRLEKQFDFLDSSRRLVLVTGHRRESFGAGLASICEALRNLVSREPVEVVYPVHLNPNVAGPVRAALSGVPHIHLLEPIDYPSFVYLMSRCHLIVTDSGGIQEEAPSLGKPVLVTRAKTERPEALEAGATRLVGTSTSSIVEGALALLHDPQAYAAMSNAPNPYGDGAAAIRIVDEIEEYLGRSPTGPVR